MKLGTVKVTEESHILSSIFSFINMYFYRKLGYFIINYWLPLWHYQKIIWKQLPLYYSYFIVIRGS